jgi:adenylate kinase family enzyme
MEKIVIIGSPGSGKSTLSFKLSKKLNINVYHMDKLFWKKNWESVGEEELINKLEVVVKKDKWIIDGNYRKTLEMRINKADTIILLDVSRYLCIYRIIKRRFLKNRVDITEGCNEKFDIEFLKFVKYIFDFKNNNQKRIEGLIDIYQEEKEVYIFSNSKQIEVFLERLV